MVMPIESLPGVRLQASAKVKAGNGTLARVTCAASSSGTLTVYDGVDNTGVQMTGAIPLTAGQQINFALAVQQGIYLALGGTADILVTYY